MKFLLITENTLVKQFFSNLFANCQAELVTGLILPEGNFPDSSITIIDATKNPAAISRYFSGKNTLLFDLKRIFIILENTSLIGEFLDIGLNNFLIEPLNEKTVKLHLSRSEKDLAEFASVFAENKKNEKTAAKLEKTLQLMPDGVVIVDANAVITYTNSQVATLFGYKQEELVGKDIETLVPAKDRFKHIGYRNNYINKPNIRPMGSQLEVFGLKKDGSSFPADISLSPINIEGELFIVSTIKDISERKTIQQELKKINEVADAASRAKSEFLANMSHELRTPLNAILGYSQILLRDRNLNRKQTEEIKIIKSSGEHLLGLISDILDVTKIEAGKMELNPIEFNLPEFLDGIAEIFKIRANEKGLSFHFEVLTTLPHFVNSDEKKLRQILFNLLSNALKFTQKGGIAIKIGQKDEKIIFQVEDTGIGIEINKQTEIFQPFTQVSNQSLRAEGTGLGLSISQKLANILGSEIKIKSVPGEGSTFYFAVELPVIKHHNIIPVLNEKVISGYKGERKKVLISDDKWENRTLLLSLLTPLEFMVFESIDGLDCLTKCIKFKPDIIFLDLRMPVMDGFEAALKIRQTEFIKDTVIIAVSASAFESDRKLSLEAGCNDFIAKPFRQEKIFQVLQKSLGLEWIYEDISKEKAVETKNEFLPFKVTGIPLPEAEKIRELAQIGNIDEILEFLKLIEIKEITYLPAIRHIQKLAKDFEFDKILNLIDENNNGH